MLKSHQQHKTHFLCDNLTSVVDLFGHVKHQHQCLSVITTPCWIMWIVVFILWSILSLSKFNTPHNWLPMFLIHTVTWNGFLGINMKSGLSQKLGLSSKNSSGRGCAFAQNKNCTFPCFWVQACYDCQLLFPDGKVLQFFQHCRWSNDVSLDFFLCMTKLLAIVILRRNGWVCISLLKILARGIPTQKF